MWKNIVEPGRPQMTIWRMRIACWIPKATNTHSEYVILLFLRLSLRKNSRYTGRFIIYSGITKKNIIGKPQGTYLRNLYRQKEQQFFPSKLFFIVVHISTARRWECMYWENGRSGGEVVLCVGISHSKSVVTVQRAFRAKYSSHHCHVTSLT